MGRAHYCSHPSRDDESWARALAVPLTKIPFKGGKSQSWDDVVGYEDLLEVCLSSIIRTVILRHISLSLMKNSNGNDVMKANVSWCQHWFPSGLRLNHTRTYLFLKIFFPNNCPGSPSYIHLYSNCYLTVLQQEIPSYLLLWSLFTTKYFLSGSVVKKKKKSTCQYRRCGFNLCVKKVPRRRKWQPIPVFLPGKSMDRKAWQATGSQRAGHDLATKQQQQKQIQGCYQAFS